MMINLQRELDAAYQILQLHQASFQAIEQAMNAQATHSVELEKRVEELETRIERVEQDNQGAHRHGL